jgi:hypothetical protein
MKSLSNDRYIGNAADRKKCLNKRFWFSSKIPSPSSILFCFIYRNLCMLNPKVCAPKYLTKTIMAAGLAAKKSINLF